jgi:hypothetical protein
MRCMAVIAVSLIFGSGIAAVISAEFAAQSVRSSPWTASFYQHQRARGKGHHAAVRALAYKWIRILYRCWKTRRPYNPELYLKALLQRGSPYASALKNSTQKS